MAVTNFQISAKTKRPACCDFDCCGNHFGRIGRRHNHRNHTLNRIVKTRRYAKHVERQMVRKDIEAQLIEVIMDIEDFNEEMRLIFGDY